MGTGASSGPAEKLLHKKRLKAKRKKTTQSPPSEFYCACRDGKIDYVKEYIDQIPKAEIDKIEPNGDTALHAATRNDHKEIVQLLIKRECSRIIFSSEGKMPHEEIKTPDMNKLYERPTPTRFYESNPKGSLDTFKPVDQEHVEEETHEYIKRFKDEEELNEYSLKQQTTAMWLKFFGAVTSKLGTVLRRPDFRPELFDLEHDIDFNEFLKEAIKDDAAYKKTKAALEDAERAKDIGPLITLYTSEFGEDKVPFFEILNKQMSLAAENDQNTAHFCDRFVYEFEMKRDQLEQRAFFGTTFRGVSMSNSDIEMYEDLSTGEKKGAIATKTFTSTTTDKDVAKRFALTKSNDKKAVLFVYEIPSPCSGIFSVMDISEFPQEYEVLMIPGTLFRVEQVLKNCQPIEIMLTHIDTKISTLHKVRHTLTATRKTLPIGKAPATDTKPTGQ